MRFTCEHDALTAAFTTAGRAVNPRSHISALAGIHLNLHSDTLTVTGSDLDLTIVTDTAVKSETSGGACILPARLTTELFRTFNPGTVTIDIDGPTATVTAGRSVSTIRTLSGDEYPHLDILDMTDSIQLPAPELHAALKQVTPYVSSEETRPILQGVLMSTEPDGLRLVATDSYRLAVCDLPGINLPDTGQAALIPGRALTELARIIGAATHITIRLTDRAAGFQVGATTIMTRLIEGAYPPYLALIPDHQPNRSTINREAFMSAVRRAAVLARHPALIRLTFDSDTVTVASATADIGDTTETVDAVNTGDSLTIGFNATYLLDGFESAGGDTVTIDTIYPLKSATIRSAGHGDFLYLLMPVRI